MSTLTIKNLLTDLLQQDDRELLAGLLLSISCFSDFNFSNFFRGANFLLRMEPDAMLFSYLAFNVRVQIERKKQLGEKKEN